MYFSNNPYRILGVPSNAGLKEIQKNISKLKAFSKIGKEMELDYNLSFLNLSKLDRSDTLLSKSNNQLNLDKDKIKNSLFWFADLSPIDSVALAHLIKGDIVKATEIWEKATVSKDVSAKNYSSFNNFSTLLFLNALDDSKTDTFKKDDTSIKQIRKAIKLKAEFISSTLFNDYCESICKSNPVSSVDAEEFFTNIILTLLRKNFTPKELIVLFEGLNSNLEDTLSDSLKEAPISNIKSHIDTASNSIKKDKKSGINAGKQLIRNTLKDVKYLKEVSSSNDLQFQSISDKLSNQILECGIVCFNETGDDQEYLSSYEYALSIAHSEKTKNRAKECVKHCKEEKIANLCSYCEEKNINRQDSYQISLYKETHRTWFPRRVQYQQATLKLYYCKSCLEKILDKDKIQKRVAYGGLIIGLIITLIMTVNIGGDEVGIVFLFMGGMFGFAGYKIGSAIGSLFGSKSITDYHPDLNKHLNQGWTKSPPTA